VTVAIIAAETVVLVLLTVLVAGLLRSHADILRRLHALDGGLEDDASTPVDFVDIAGARSRVADVVGTGLRDDALQIPIAGVAHRTVLAFLSSGCLTCAEFWDAFADIGALDLPADLRLVAVTKDATEESPAALRSLASPGLTVVMSSAAWAEYEVPGSPYFVMIDGASGRVEGEGTGGNWEQVHNLIVQASADGSDGAAREARIDRELLAHGIVPGDPILYHDAAQ
jgi:hypothetical protein